jgi:hypothetical protein
MKRLENFKSAYKLVVASLSPIISVFVIDYLNSFLPSRSVSAAIMLIIVVSVIIVATFLMERLVDSSYLLRRIISGSDFVEGFWYDISREATSNRAAQGAVLFIHYEDGEVKVSGISFDDQGNKIASFSSISATYVRRTLYYQYNTQSRYAPSFAETGIGQIMFDHPPRSYTGFWLDFTSGIMYRVEGERVSNKQLREFNGFSTLDEKQRFLTQIIRAENSGLPIDETSDATDDPSIAQG